MLLCYVTDRHLLQSQRRSGAGSTDDLLVCIERAVNAGVDWIQIREKDLTSHELLELTRRAIAVTRQEGNAHTRVIVNDRLDVAIAAGAAGVHLGGASIPIAETVQWCRAGNAPQDFMVGASCHDIQEAIAAERSGGNYILFGPVYESPAKMKFGAPQGVGKLAEVCGRIQIPVLAIGGVEEENAGTCLRAAAAGIAAIRLFQQPPDAASLGGVVSRLRAIRLNSTR
ncbi:MAG TPA: thiamine phosphate synthase [Candidatus Acidoferrales bacterium]|nr:thiamine phosphate synthase [Candidatus Acidoferrales bacterium]